MILTLLLSAVLPVAAHAAKNVLLLFDEDNDLPGRVVINRTIRDVITTELNTGVDFYSESLNLSQFSGVEQDAIMLDYLRRRYADKPLDVVVAVMSPALDFLLRHLGFAESGPRPDAARRAAGFAGRA